MKKNILTKKGKILEFLIALFLILIGVSLRLFPHPPNFAPIAAIAIFGGFYFSKKVAFSLPLFSMIISDIFIGFYDTRLMISVYGSFILCVILGFWLKKHRSLYSGTGICLLGAVLFFTITNLAVWVITPWYEKTILGLIQCYLMGLPFFKNTILGNMFYATFLFGTHEAARLWIRKKFSLDKQTNEIGYVVN